MYLSLDVGTTVVKAVLFDKNGREIQVEEQPCNTMQMPDGTAEQCPNELAQAMWSVLKRTLHSEDGQKTEAICISTQGGSFVPLTADAMPVHNIITWMDSRASYIVKEWKDTKQDVDIRQKSGWWPEAGLPLATIEWFRHNCPKAFEKTAHFCSMNDYLVVLLTGNYFTNPSCAGEMLLMDPETQAWQPDLLKRAKINKRQCSQILPANAVVGVLSSSAIKMLGTEKALPVYNGGQDHTLEALAIGMTDSKDALLACGTAWVLNTAATKQEINAAPTAMGVNPHVVGQRWILSQYLGCFGAVFEWWAQNMWQSPQQELPRKELYACINSALAVSSAHSSELLCLPFSGGKQLGQHRETTLFEGGDLSKNREDWTLALMEGILYEVRWALENLLESRFCPSELWMIGGATRNSVWPQMAADILGLPIKVSNYSHGPALGAAMIAAVACGQFENYESCRQVFRIQAQRFLPSKALAQRYQSQFICFKQISQQQALNKKQGKT